MKKILFVTLVLLSSCNQKKAILRPYTNETITCSGSVADGVMIINGVKVNISLKKWPDGCASATLNWKQ